MESASILDRTKKMIEKAHLAGKNIETRINNIIGFAFGEERHIAGRQLRKSEEI